MSSPKEYFKGDLVLHNSNVCIIREILQSPLGYRTFMINDLATGEEMNVSKHSLELFQDWDTDIIMPDVPVSDEVRPSTMEQLTWRVQQLDIFIWMKKRSIWLLNRGSPQTLSIRQSGRWPYLKVRKKTMK